MATSCALDTREASFVKRQNPERDTFHARRFTFHERRRRLVEQESSYPAAS